MIANSISGVPIKEEENVVEEEEGQSNGTSMFSTYLSPSGSDDAVITGFGLTGVTMSSPIVSSESGHKLVEEVPQNEKDPSISDDKDQLGKDEGKNREYYKNIFK